MYRKLVLAMLLLTSAAWLHAQSGYSQSNGNQNSGDASKPASVEGCLQGSDGNYTLRADSGTVYQLTGDTSKLAEHVGHEVRVMGSMSGSSAASTPSAMTPGASQQSMLNVKGVKHLSATCKSASK